MRSQACKLQLVREIVKRSEDFALDPSIHKHCARDVQFFCADVPHGNGRVQKCLRRNYKSLWASCRDAEFKQEVRENQDARFLVGFLAACREEKGKFCAQEDPESVLSCLQDVSFADMSRKCVNAIAAVEKVQMQNVQLNHPLYSACRPVIDRCEKLKQDHDAASKAKGERRDDGGKRSSIGRFVDFLSLRCGTLTDSHATIAVPL